MKETPDRRGALEEVFLQSRLQLLDFIRRRGGADASEDILHDVWIRLSRIDPEHVQAPLSYLFRIAHSVVVDRYYQGDSTRRREQEWREMTGPDLADRSEQPLPDRVIEARETANRLLEALTAEGARVAQVFRRHRIDGVSQRDVAVEMGVSLSTVESDLRRAYRVLVIFRRRQNEV